MIQSFATRDEAAQAAADFLARALESGLTERGGAALALSGGSTPKAAYQKLATQKLDWSRITFLQVDERCVPARAPGLNADMLREALAPALAQGAHLIPLWRGDASPDQAAATASALYARETIDAALLGMGADGHTASWFSGSPDLSRALDPQTQETMIRIHAPSAEAASTRLTMTLPALAAVRALALLIQGDDKRAKLEHALAQETAQTAPVLALLKARSDCAILWAA